MTHLTPTVLFPRLIDAIPDDHDVRTLALLMLSKLIVLAPAETLRNLPALGEKFRGVLSQKPKENAVKQEIEKMQEASRGVLKASLDCDRAFPGAGSGDSAGDMASWRQYIEWMRKEFSQVIRAIGEERD